MQGQKHLVKCRCVLPQYRHLENPTQHRFIVFSVIDDDGSVIPKHVQCNNCGIVHKVTDICVSEFVNKEDVPIVSIEDIACSLPDKLVGVLERHKVDLPTWEAVQFIIENEKWGDFVLLESDDMHGETVGKYIIILGKELFKVKTFERNDTV